MSTVDWFQSRLAAADIWQSVSRRVAEARQRLSARWSAAAAPAEVAAILSEELASCRSDPERALLLLEAIPSAFQLFDADPAEARALRSALSVLESRHECLAHLIAGALHLQEAQLNTLPPGQFAAETLSAAPPGRDNSQNAPPIQERCFGNYVLLHNAGQGGMGEVFRARQVNAARDVALKRVKGQPGGSFSPPMAELFQKEANAGERLRHPNIVGIHDVGTVDGVPYFTMDWIDGGDLEAQLSQGPMPQQRAARIGKKVADALQYAHDRKVLHRDLKPKNILLDPGERRLSKEEEPMICDFGLAAIVPEQGQLSAHGLIGTHAYMSPEQASGRALDDDALRRSDIFNLGATLYHLLVGQPPYSGSRDKVLAKAQAADFAPAGTQAGSRLHPDLAAIVNKCLSKDPRARYDSAQALAADLERFLDGRPVHARPVGPLVHLQRWARRRPGLAALAAALLVLVGFGLGTFYRLGQVRQQRDLAKSAESRAVAAEAAKRASLAQSRASEARLMMTRARNHQAVARFDDAIDEGYPDAIELRLEKIAALVASSQTELAEVEARELANLTSLGRHTGKLRMWQAEFELPKSSAKAIELYEEALKLGLGDADRLYVEGMLASTSPEALAKFDAALEFDPFHERAIGTSATMLVWLGRIEEANERMELLARLFPDQKHVFKLRAAVLALRGNLDEALRIVNDSKLIPSVQERKDMKALVEFVHEVSQTTWQPVGEQGAAGGQIAAMLDLMRRGKTLLDVSKTGTHLPPRIGQHFIGFVGRALLAALAANFGQLGPLEYALDLVLKNHSEGTLHLMSGIVAAGRDDYDAARRSFLLARQTPAIFSFVQGDAEVMLATLWSYRYFVDDDKQARDEAVRWIAAVIDNDRPVPEYGFLSLSRAATAAGEFTLARRVQDRWHTVKPNEIDINFCRAETAFRAGEYFSACQYAERVLQLDPKHQLVPAIREASRQKIEASLKPPAKQEAAGDKPAAVGQ